MAAATRPNFVVIMADQQSRSQLGCYGNPVSRTPHLDRLASGGVRFDAAYTSCPLCSPARAGIFTGLAPDRAGVWGNELRPHQGVRNLGEIFRGLGYRTAYTGKWHLDAGGYFGTGVPAEGFEPQWWYDGRTYRGEIGEEDFRWYVQAGDAAKLRERNVPDDFCWAHRLTDRAIGFLDDVRDEPFALVVSYDEPHPPMVCPPRYLDLYDPADLPIPETLHESLEDKPPVQQKWARWCRERWNLCEDTLREGMRHWYACNTFADDQIGRVLDAIDARHADNTVVIYTTDHGDYYGSHGLLGKGPAMYDETVRVPLLIRAPHLAPRGAACPSLASTLDILPTMLDLAGEGASEALDGVSLRANLERPADETRDAVEVQFHSYGPGTDAFGGFYPIRCIRTPRWKLSVNLLESDELYDLHADPLERENLIHSPDHHAVRDELHGRLLERMHARGDMVYGDGVRCRPWARGAVRFRGG